MCATCTPDTCCCGLQTADKENNPRGINRHKFSIAEAEEALQQPVVQALLDLCKFRNSHPAFNGKVWSNLHLRPAVIARLLPLHAAAAGMMH